MDVQLGSPRTHHCSSLGICQMHVPGTVPESQCRNLVSAFARIDRPTGRLLLHIVTDTIAEAVRQLHFPTTGFRVRDDYQLPNWVTEALRLPPGDYRIACGRYPSLDDGTFTTLSFRLAQSATVSTPVLRLAA